MVQNGFIEPFSPNYVEKKKCSFLNCEKTTFLLSHKHFIVNYLYLVVVLSNFVYFRSTAYVYFFCFLFSEFSATNTKLSESLQCRRCEKESRSYDQKLDDLNRNCSKYRPR